MSKQSKALEDARACVRWIQSRSGARNVMQMRRLAKAHPAAAAIIAAIDTSDPDAVRESMAGAAPAEIMRRLSDVCMVWAGIGSDDRPHCCRVWSGESQVFDNLVEAILWCVEGLPAGFGAEEEA